MRLTPITATAALLLLMALAGPRLAGAADAAAADDWAKLAGTWSVVVADKGGRPTPPDRLAKMSVVIAETTITINEGGRSEPAEVAARDPSKTPATIDLRSAKAKDEPPVLGIYKVDGDKLTICYRKGDGGRPTEFKAGERTVLLELVRRNGL